MDVTPQLLHDVEFREAKRGGYNTQDVDEFLERLALGLERQGGITAEAQQRIDAAEARAEAAEHRAAQAELAASETSASDDTLRRTLVLAQRTADAAIREAEEQAHHTLTEAQAEAERLLSDAHATHAQVQAEAESEARAAHEKARTQVLGEMRDLVAARDRLREDLRLLERHLDDQRERVRVTVEELQRLLDDPDALEGVPAPPMSDVAAPPEAVPAAEPSPVVETSPAWEPEDAAWEDDPAELVDVRADEDGPPTEAVDTLAEQDEDDDAYLTELRKAMTDESPLGPREEGAGSGFFDATPQQERSRFGRRR